jgi:hypothetical protein
MTRCPMAVRFGVTLHTRCAYPAGHEALMHEGRGLFPDQRITWAPGDVREYRTDRTDELAWEEAA